MPYSFPPSGSDYSLAANSVTADKLAAALANNVGANQTGVTNRSAMTAMTTERTTTANSTGASSWTDVTGASLTFTVTSGSYIIVGFNAQVKSTTTSYYRVLADAAVCAAVNGIGTDYSPYWMAAGNTAGYVKVGGMAMLSAAEIGTGSKTFKWQMTGLNYAGTPTSYINNCYLSVTQVTF